MKAPHQIPLRFAWRCEECGQPLAENDPNAPRDGTPICAGVVCQRCITEDDWQRGDEPTASHA